MGNQQVSWVCGDAGVACGQASVLVAPNMYIPKKDDAEPAATGHPAARALRALPLEMIKVPAPATALVGGRPERAHGGGVEQLQELDAYAVCSAVASSLRGPAGNRF